MDSDRDVQPGPRQNCGWPMDSDRDRGDRARRSGSSRSAPAASATRWRRRWLVPLGLPHRRTGPRVRVCLLQRHLCPRGLLLLRLLAPRGAVGGAGAVLGLWWLLELLLRPLWPPRLCLRRRRRRRTRRGCGGTRAFLESTAFAAVKTKTGALLRSAAFPGLGQLYNDKKIEGYSLLDCTKGKSKLCTQNDIC